MKVKFYLRGGSIVEFECDKVTLERNNLTGRLVGYKAKGVSGYEKPMHINVDEIIAVTTCEEEHHNG